MMTIMTNLTLDIFANVQILKLKSLLYKGIQTFNLVLCRSYSFVSSTSFVLGVLTVLQL